MYVYRPIGIPRVTMRRGDVSVCMLSVALLYLIEILCLCPSKIITQVGIIFKRDNSIRVYY